MENKKLNKLINRERTNYELREQIFFSIVCLITIASQIIGKDLEWWIQLFLIITNIVFLYEIYYTQNTINCRVIDKLLDEQSKIKK